MLKDILQIGLKKILWLKKLKIMYYGNMLLVVLMVKKFLERFMTKNWKKTNHQEFRTENVIKRKGEELYVKLKDYDNYINSWIDEKGIIYNKLILY